MTEIVAEAKVVVLGDTGVGKTSIVLRFVEQRFTSNVPPTIGASFLTKTLYLEGVRLKLQLWDTAGQERFRSLAPMYYRGAAVALIVFDVTLEDSFLSMQEWVKELRSNVVDDLLLVIVANQIDKIPRKITTEEASEYARSIGALFFETSAKKNLGIDQMFSEIARYLVQVRIPNEIATAPSPTVVPALSSSTVVRESTCC